MSTPGRIGHLASEVDTYVKAGALGLRKRYRGVLIAPPDLAANTCLLGYWRRYITTVQSPFWSRVGWQLQAIPYLKLDLSDVSFNKTARYIEVQKAWGERGPILRLSEADRRRGRAALAELGVPENAQFVCFHAREPGYSPSDDAIHTYRNCSIENYLPAVRELTGRGYWCIRMGDTSSKPIEARPGVIDYAHSPLRSDWMDVFLCADCKFFLGSSGGVLFLANIFGTPTATANHAPLATVLAFGLHDIAIPKLVRSKSDHRYLTLPEIFNSEVANLRFTSEFEDRDLETVENSPDDIRGIAVEMLERIEGRTATTSSDDDLQARFRSMFRPGHYGYGGLNRVGRDFLRKYRHLLE